MKIKKCIFILFMVFVLFFYMELFMPEKILFMPLCIIFEITAYFILFKPQNKSVLLLSVLLCFLSTVNMALDVLFNINGNAEILCELNKVFYISSFNFITLLYNFFVNSFVLNTDVSRL